ncbi:conjugated polyketone reductase C1 [Infundibulicybe gibba]|nr:conjugated polyketone reductase C1 [Infundibulicybe gibba]
MALSTPSFTLLDGTTIPWLAWGNGTGKANKNPVESGRQALDAGVRHIDTAQNYGTEKEAAEAVSKSSLSRDDVYITTKLSPDSNDDPVPLDKVPSLIEESIKKLGSIPDLFLIHTPLVVPPGQLKACWKILEDFKSAGKLKSIGVSNFQIQDFEVIMDGAKYKPVVNQIEFHPYVMAHLEPVIAFQKKHGIVTESYGPLTPILRHPTKGPIKPILERIAARLSKETGKPIDIATVLLLWTRAQGVVAVSASGDPERIKRLAEISLLPDLLKQEEIEEITAAGKKVHFRHYREHMERDFPLPNLPNDL